MNNLFNRLAYVCAVFLMLIPLVSCGGGGGGDGGTAGTGTLSLGLTDGPGDYLHVFVTIESVEACRGLEGEEKEDNSCWVPLSSIPKQTIDLIELANGFIQYLDAELDAGYYNQIRLKIGITPDDPTEHQYANYVIIEGEEGQDSTEVELRALPSEIKEGIKIVQGFEIVDNDYTELFLDFDAYKSVVRSNGKNGWHLKPTIKVLETIENSLSGNVKGPEDNLLDGVRVSAQLNNSGVIEPEDEVYVEGWALSDLWGEYSTYLPPNIYNIVAVKIGYAPKCQVFDATVYDNHELNFELVEETETITISGTISGLDSDTDTALLSIRQHDFVCGGSENVTIEVASDNPTNGSYSITIPAPAGTMYDLVASADGKITVLEADIKVNTTMNIEFQPL